MNQIFCLLLSVSTAAAGLVSTIQQENTVSDSADVPVLLTLTNTGSGLEELYPWQVALDKKGVLTANIFNIVNEATGAQVPYVGMMAKRFIANYTTNPADMIRVRPGQTLTINIVDLAMDYAFDTNGIFTVEWRGAETSDKSSIKVTNALGDRRFGPNADLTNPTPLNCNNQQTSNIQDTHYNARTQIINARNNLASGTTNLFREWFGTGNKNTVTSCWNSINSRHSNGYRMQCNQQGCPANTYAYVYPSDTTFTVYLCSVFWSRPSERAETLTHELSHFNSVCRTDDWTYGRANCRALAQSNPARAIDNADNHCYFGADA